MANIIDFEYPIEFISGARVWTSPVPQVNDLLVFSVGHQIDRMSAEWVDITFGMKLDGLPSASLSNTSFSFVDEVLDGAPAGGLQHVINQVINGPVVTEGLQRLSRITGDRIDPLIERYREVVIQPILAQAYDDLRADYLAGSPNPPPRRPPSRSWKMISSTPSAMPPPPIWPVPARRVHSRCLPTPPSSRPSVSKSTIRSVRPSSPSTSSAANQAGALFNPGPLQNYPNTAAFAMALMVVGQPADGSLRRQPPGPGPRRAGQ